ncbi:MAG: hypothetical protein MR902_03225 [Campylobacter sp.]|nr:hypothetical protein [Campylobacter sp.]
MVASATYASYYAVLTPAKDGENIDNWLFPLNSGIKFEKSAWNGLGMRGNVSCPMIINVDESYRIGKSGSGAKQVFETVAPYFVLGLTGIYSGVCENMLEYSVNKAKNRVYPNGKNLANIETVQIHLAKIYSLAKSATALSIDARNSAKNGDADALAKILSARIVASTNAIETATIAMRIGGGKAIIKLKLKDF